MEQQKSNKTRKRHVATTPHTQKPPSKGIDMDELLEVLMNVSAEDHVVLEWAYLTMDEHQIKRSLAEARRTVAAALEHDDVAQLLTEASVRALFRGARWVRLEQARHPDGPARKIR